MPDGPGVAHRVDGKHRLTSVPRVVLLDQGWGAPTNTCDKPVGPDVDVSAIVLCPDGDGVAVGIHGDLGTRRLAVQLAHEYRNVPAGNLGCAGAIEDHGGEEDRQEQQQADASDADEGPSDG